MELPLPGCSPFEPRKPGLAYCPMQAPATGPFSKLSPQAIQGD